MPLTALAIGNAKPHENKTVKLSDGGGLQLWIQPTGSKLWYLAYRFGGKQRKLAIGPLEFVNLKDARARREAAKALLASGIDPSQQKKAQKANTAAAGANTFSTIAEEMLAKNRADGLADVTVTKKEWLLTFANPALGSRPIGEISSAEVLAVLRKVEARGHIETAHRLRSVIGSVFAYAIATARAENDVVVPLRHYSTLKKKNVTSRAGIIDPTAFGGLLRAIDGYTG